MGSWFSNIHIRKHQTATEETVEKFLREYLTAQNYLPVESKSDADGAVAIVAGAACPWISVYSDLLPFEEPGKHAEIAASISTELHTDVLGISCFDSDYLYLNLINAADQTNAWIGIGSASGLGIKRRSGLSSWKGKVSDFSAFSEGAKKKYIFAEEFLTEAEPCLGLPAIRSSASYECLSDFDLDKEAKCFYFKLPDEMKTGEPVKLVSFLNSCSSCFLDKPSVVNCVNVGGESRGLSVYFLGSYVEKDEITFSDVCFVRENNRDVPIALSKTQLPDGQWAYCFHDPGFRIPPKADDRLPLVKRVRMRSERSIVVRFVPHGNPRKILDITVVLVPDKNPEGLIGWNVWHHWGSKKAFIDHYNGGWDKIRQTCQNPDVSFPILREEDFD